MTTKDLLFFVVDEHNDRDDMAIQYAEALAQMDSIEWPHVNLAIKERWSLFGLKYIKNRAWKLYEKAKSE